MQHEVTLRNWLKYKCSWKRRKTPMTQWHTHTQVLHTSGYICVYMYMKTPRVSVYIYMGEVWSLWPWQILLDRHVYMCLLFWRESFSVINPLWNVIYTPTPPPHQLGLMIKRALSSLCRLLNNNKYAGRPHAQVIGRTPTTTNAWDR